MSKTMSDSRATTEPKGGLFETSAGGQEEEGRVTIVTLQLDAGDLEREGWLAGLAPRLACRPCTSTYCH